MIKKIKEAFLRVCQDDKEIINYCAKRKFARVCFGVRSFIATNAVQSVEQTGAINYTKQRYRALFQA